MSSAIGNGRLPRVSSRECIAALLNLGFTVDRRRGSHTYLRRGESVANVPHRQCIPVGTMKLIIRDSGVSKEEFIQALP